MPWPSQVAVLHAENGHQNLVLGPRLAFRPAAAAQLPSVHPMVPLQWTPGLPRCLVEVMIKCQAKEHPCCRKGHNMRTVQPGRTLLPRQNGGVQVGRQLQHSEVPRRRGRSTGICGSQQGSTHEPSTVGADYSSQCGFFRGSATKSMEAAH